MPPNIFSIAADRPFLATLARGLVDRTGDDRLALTRITVLLPTRRAARSLREAFLRLTGEGADPGAPLLLPRMRAIGDLDDDELSVGIEDAGDGLVVPPPLPELRRTLLLTQLILKWSGRPGGDRLLAGQAAGLAGALARLLDAAATDGAEFTRLRDLAPAELAEHWQKVLDFLDILPGAWPGILVEEGALDPAERRNRLLRRQAQLWRQAPPAHPVIAAGLVGGFPALDELLGCVAWLDQGAVILPGLDRRAEPGEWAEIGADPAHPQHLLARLLAGLEIAPEDVRDWPPGYRAAPTARRARLHLAAEALRPAATTDRWRALPPPEPDALAGLSRYDCASPQDEAVTAALLLRRQLETPGATAALVTPDRELARRVAAELTRWGIEIDDSAGLPLNRTPPGAFLRLVLDLADSDLAPVPLLAALKHPLAAGGLPRDAFRDRARRLEEKIRGPRPAPGFKGLQDALGADAELHLFVERLRLCLGALPDLLASKDASVAELATVQIAAAERLAATDEKEGAALLWRELAGEAAALFCHELIAAARDFPPLAGRDYPALFEALAAGAVVRPAFGRHPRLAIWGLVEARLQQADRVVLGGLNEGTWPGPAAFDPWMSRQMREEFGIALPERAIGIAAHDFAQALGAPQVALTRAARREGVPTVPSRWLLRLDAVLRAAGLENALGPEPDIAGAVLARNLPGPHRPRPVARPCPPVTARPRQLSVTQVEMWRRDPYAIYARHILRLRPLDDLDADPSRADLGNAVHEALAQFVGRHPHGLPVDAERELLEIAENSFADWLSRPSIWAFWWPRFERVARWFVAEEAARHGDIALSVSEQRGTLVVAAPAGPFTVSAVADRIDRLTDGGLVIIDYKTGQLPQKREIDNGLALQLPLEGAIARDGGFAAIAGEPRRLEYWRLSGGEPAGQRKPIGDGDPVALIDRTVAEVTALVARFDNPGEPYLVVPVLQWRPRYSDYEHLERLGALREDEIEAAGGEP
ncbi:MAG TPA: double-strand break repair protein AddB [Stellaceae bacterium]|nr:double-strand break repair protein AddB [Stellaceae bacterium]